MSVGYGIELDLYVELQEAFSEDQACEHSKHQSNPEGHQGKAEWYLQIKCPRCGNSGDVLSVCDRWKYKVVDAGIPVWCIDGCDLFSTGWKILVCEKIGE